MAKCTVKQIPQHSTHTIEWLRLRSLCTTTHLMLFSERLTDICVVHDDLEWKNWTTRYKRFWRAGCCWL